MGLTPDELDAFFNEEDQMGLPSQVRAHFAQTEPRIQDLDDLAEMADCERSGGDMDVWEQMFEEDEKILHIPFCRRIQYRRRLRAAAHAVRYYRNTSREPDAQNMHWTNVLSHFWGEYEYSILKGKSPKIQIPKITPERSILWWTVHFEWFLQENIGGQDVPLAYVIRKMADVPKDAPELALNQAYSRKHGSIRDELIARCPHDRERGFFKYDNQQVYHHLVCATQGTRYENNVKAFQRTENGRSTWLSLVDCYAGETQWRAVIQSAEEVMLRHKWKENGNVTLIDFISKHQRAYSNMSEASRHVSYQVPTEATRVWHLFNNMEYQDASLALAILNVRNDKQEGGMWHDFLAASQALRPHDPVAKRHAKAESKRFMAEMTSGSSILDNLHARYGKTGVEFRDYSAQQLDSLTADQFVELQAFREAREEAGMSPNPPKRSKKKRKKAH